MNLIESEVRKLIREYLVKSGWFVFHVHQQGYMAYKGISDYIAVKNGKVIFLECKKFGGKQSPHQLKFEDDIVSHGGIYLCCDSVDKLHKQLQGYCL